ncbi:uncharacterized protein KQ657_004609 [Scheffersomyces spartinae]|uniref:Uncharacterized protein n=1 Tax=Scheffersomyces spartinae TaxID=45513 RepID=A0A9P7VAF6_9ASCO|nr:uncharacterized protein KQ657_004609 [Scheffersomyces spartinae]KAG7194396.1 hypothetical protein KQ657_004609 [Scheffersomyces spartinae]
MHGIDLSGLTNKSPREVASSFGSSPFPAWLFGSSLLYKGIFTPKALVLEGTLGDSVKFAKALAAQRPTKTSCLAFGATSLLGGWIIYDGDILNGAGFTAVWSTLYLLVNGSSSIKSVLRGRISPLALSTLALGNAGVYGLQFVYPSGSSTSSSPAQQLTT